MRTLLGSICLLLLGGLLIAGLAPFGRPRNRVHWLKNQNGLRFDDRSIAVSSGHLTFPPGSRNECSLELYFRPAAITGSATIFAIDSTDAIHAIHAIDAPQSLAQFSIRQSLSDILLRSDREAGSSRLYLDYALQAGKPVFLSITSGTASFHVYVNGTLATGSLARNGQASPDLFSPASLQGTLLLGHSVTQHDSWDGEVLGLAIYDKELSTQRIARHQSSWTADGHPDIAAEDGNRGLYLFKERAGRTVHDSSGKMAPDFLIPERYSLRQQLFLTLPWREFKNTGWYWADVLINIAGFIPFGFVLRAYLSWVPAARWPFLQTVFAGAAISLTIEILQSHLPTRDSSTTDVITNVLGTALGSILFSTRIGRIFRRKALVRLANLQE